ncbi:ribonuclease J [filamentous cyanobacterium LEGE 11480]|uniref:Ribonuclease J n=1 Tax=Romeriopsis navalis LEGE 11480 TaxID=2777977 RepID=A0A928VLF3_9CYAN|nr:ribonuclease J [Romeriopsis navalis]MBE9030763.1 ribonuclease J [Romeriopsis navalis LEGE 11480]
MSQTESALKVIPLGGLHEIGKNTLVFEYEDEILLYDAGLSFPTEGMHGVNIVLPDTTYLRENRDKIKGMVVTHGHEDHIGGIAFHLKQVDIPVIYGPRLALALLRGKLQEAGVEDRTELRTVAPRDFIRIGKHFLVEFIRNTHSMADSFTVAIHTPKGIIIQTGDFKFDHTPVDGEKFDIQRLAEYGEKGVLCLISDSTNSEVPGFTPSEGSVFPNLDRVFSQAKARLMVTTFASSVHRVNMILQLAEKHGRSVAILGRSMLNVIAHARTLGYIRCKDSTIIPLNSIHKLPDHKVLILMTGSQGEPMAALTRISRQEHRQVKIKDSDTVVFSANPIPGNTISVVNVIDRLMMQGAKVIYGKAHGIHVSGHGCQEDQKWMIALTKPKFFLPVHGEHRMLVKHSQTAQSMGVPAENMVIIENGDIVELTEDSIRKHGKVPSGIELIDTSRSGIVTSKVLEERQQIAGDGAVTIVSTVTEEGKLFAKPEMHLRGVVSSVDRGALQTRIQESIAIVLNERWTEFARKLPGSDKIDIDWAGLQVQMEREVNRLLKRELQSNPMLVFLMQSPDAEGAAKLSKARRQATPKPEPKRGSAKPAKSVKPVVAGSAKPVVEKKKVIPAPKAEAANPIAEAASSTAPTRRRRTRSSATKV